MIEDRERNKPKHEEDPRIESFTTETNAIQYIALSKQHKGIDEIAKKMGADEQFLRRWVTAKLDYINQVLKTHREEIQKEIERFEAR